MARHTVLDADDPAKVPANLCALGIMTKAPEPGKVKTRLSPPLSPEEAAELNRCFLKDISRSIAEASATTSACGVGVYTPVGAEAAYDNILPAGFYLIPQQSGEFGERLIFAAEDLFRCGFASVCLINSDSPTVPARCFLEAARELAVETDRIVLGPSDDGGYYLIGMKRLHRRLFEQIDWSTERVLGQTRERAGELKLPVHHLPSALDVDDRTSLKRVYGELLHNRSTPAVATRDYLGTLNLDARL